MPNNTSDDSAWQNSIGKHYPGLDGLRAAAILIVIWHTVGLQGGSPIQGFFLKLYEMILDTGWIGVQLFFVLSGFLITGILLDAKSQRHPFRNFYVRRVLRIFPLYYGTLVLLFVVLPFFDVSSDHYAVDQAEQKWFWLYLVNWLNPFHDGGHLAHFWSLAIEEQFYLAWPLAVIFLRQHTLVRLCLLLIFSAIISRLILVTYFPEIGHRAAYTFTIARWDALAIGALLSIWIRNESFYRHLRRWAPRIASIAAILILIQIFRYRSFAPAGVGTLALNQTLIAAWFSTILFLAIDRPASKLTARYQLILGLPVFRIVARHSYAMYIFHVPISNLWFDGYAPAIGHDKVLATFLIINFNCLVVATASFLAALVSWKLLEQPFLRMKKRFVA